MSICIYILPNKHTPMNKMNSEVPLKRENEKLVLEPMENSKRRVKVFEGVYPLFNEDESHFCHNCASVKKI